MNIKSHIISPVTEQRIKDAAGIVDVLDDALGVQLHRDGANLQGLCPFHDDRHLGSFKVSETRNICTCFSCGKTWNPVDALMQGRQMKYGEALRWLAAKYGIYVDEQPVPSVKPAKKREPMPELPMLYWTLEQMPIRYMYDKAADSNTLMSYLFSLPMTKEDHNRLKAMSMLYMVGTSVQGETKGWTIWWQIDVDNRVRSGKVMLYSSNGHRDKQAKYSFNFVHSIMAKAGRIDLSKCQYQSCLFGEHLVDMFPNAEICIVESEKSALICSAFTDPQQRLWLATAGKSGLSRKKLQPLIDRQRYIVIYPDKDGYDEWRAMADMIGYNRLSVSRKVNELWQPTDGDKADIADIMLRTLQPVEETVYDVAARRLGMKELPDGVRAMIDELRLTID